MAEGWRVEPTLNRRTLKKVYTVKRGDEFLRMAGRFTTIRRFRTEAGAQRACDKANASSGVTGGHAPCAETYAGCAPDCHAGNRCTPGVIASDGAQGEKA